VFLWFAGPTASCSANGAPYFASCGLDEFRPCAVTPDSLCDIVSHRICSVGAHTANGVRSAIIVLARRLQSARSNLTWLFIGPVGSENPCWASVGPPTQKAEKKVDTYSIEQVDEPFLIIFFLLAGFHFDVATLGTMGLIGLGYIVARALGLLVGGYLGSRLGKAPANVATHIGWCLLPQAGVALGLGLIAKERFPDVGSQVLSTNWRYTKVARLACACTNH
jgi:hypothetical protein